MKPETMKNKIAELNLIVKGLSEDCTRKGQIIEAQEITINSQKGLIAGLRTDNRDLQDALFITDRKLEKSEDLNKLDSDNNSTRMLQMKGRIEMAQQMLKDASEEREY
jgi:hypothetical protein